MASGGLGSTRKEEEKKSLLVQNGARLFKQPTMKSGEWTT
jgi:hypothetical protein